MTIAVTSPSCLSEPNGSSFRPLMQCEGLKANGFSDFKLFGSDSLGDLNENNFSIIHAHQTSGLLFNNYLVDLHGVFTRQLKDALGKYSFVKRKAAEFLRLPEVRRMERRLLERAKAIICAGESIEAFARQKGTAFLIRNCVNVSLYKDCDWSSTRIAVCGPFLKIYQNRYQLEHIVRIAKAFPKLSFVLIGRIENEDLRTLRDLTNIQPMGYVNNFVETLRSCSVLFAPYPHFTSQGGAKTKLIEAAACGMCIVATPYAVCDFFAENSMIDEEDECLAKHLLYLTENEDNRKSVGQRMKKYVLANHDHLAETKKLIKVYEEFSD